MDTDIFKKDAKTPKKPLTVKIDSLESNFDMAEQESPLLQNRRLAVDHARMKDRVMVIVN